MIAYRSVLSSGSSPTPPTPVTGTIYGFHIDSSVSDPSNAITYLEDAVGMTPAYMDFTNDVFDYGSWENAFFMPKPCMLKFDGTVDYYLDPSDYTKKADGTTSDIDDPTYNGNAMMEWGQNGKKIWMKIVPDTNDDTSASIYIADAQIDSEYHDWSFHNSQGISADHFYTAIYQGSLDANNKLRSISGTTTSYSKTMQQHIDYAKANNPSSTEMWNIECYSDRLLITMLCFLITKTLNSSLAFGYGMTSISLANMQAYINGTQNTKGLFYGTMSAAAAGDAIKIFGMENFYGGFFNRINGIIINYGDFKVKNTYGIEDGSYQEGYNIEGTGYKSRDNITSTLSGWISKYKFKDDCMIPFEVGQRGSSATYYCDYCTLEVNRPKNSVAFGGTYDSGNVYSGLTFFHSGAYSLPGSIYNYEGASLSCKP